MEFLTFLYLYHLKVCPESSTCPLTEVIMPQAAKWKTQITEMGTHKNRPTSMSKRTFNFLTWHICSPAWILASYLHRFIVQYLQQEARHSIIWDRWKAVKTESGTKSWKLCREDWWWEKLACRQKTHQTSSDAKIKNWLGWKVFKIKSWSLKEIKSSTITFAEDKECC